MGFLSMGERTCGCDDLVRIRRFKNGRWESIEDMVSREEALTVTWNDLVSGLSGTVVLWAWPHDLAELSLGHVLLDCMGGQARGRDCRVSSMGTGYFSVVLSPALAAALPPPPPALLEAPQLLEAMRTFIGASGRWKDTGCFHRAGIYSPDQDAFVAVAEDIGRHNCLDRLAGWAALADISLTDKVFLTTARLTASLCAKALRAGFRVLVSRSAVTSASIALAEAQSATLVGFTRTGEERLSVFTDIPGRFGPASCHE